MPTIQPETLDAYRATTFRLREAARLQSVEQAVEFVNERGFVYFWPIKGILFPSLWTAVVGNRKVADKHDDPGHVTWGWKDDMLDKKQWYYAKILRGKATMVSLTTVPYFYALSENFGDPEEDYLQLYADGLLTRAAKTVYATILREGPLNTIALRRATQMTSKAAKSPFDRALVQLQRDFEILPVAVAEAGAWRYSFVYEAVHRFYPDIARQAREISRSQARQQLLSLYFEMLGAATFAEVRKLFQWTKRDLERPLQALVASGRIIPNCQLSGDAIAYYAHPNLFT